MPSRVDSSRRELRLRVLLGMLLLGLAIPAALLIRQGFVQVELTEFRRQQLIAEDLVRAIDARLKAAIDAENARPVTDFDYAVPTTGGAVTVVQLSPLSSLAAAGTFPGAIGYFQVDTSGQLSTPLLPESDLDTVPAAERAAKITVEARLADVLEANRLVQIRADDGPRAEVRAAGGPARDDRQESAEPPAARPAAISIGATTGSAQDAARGQAAFDELASTAARAPEDTPAKTETIETGDGRAPPESREALHVSTFAGDIEPLRFSLLETGHFVLFRNAWREGQRFVQGMLIDRDAFIADVIEPSFDNAGLAAGTRLTVTTAGKRTATLHIGDAAAGGQSDGSALYETRLSPPLADIDIAFASGVLERGPAFNLLIWTAVALFGVLVGGFVAIYRFSMQQMRLVQQQQNFVSAVSHELKTPLTSIRMYGEMLKSGWADEQKKQVYYDYIFDEGERLSRLIDNVLQLARLNRGGPAIAPEPVAVAELFDVLRSKLSTQAERAGFALRLEVDPAAADEVISADVDALIQVFINLVDNGIKFSGAAATREIVITARCPDKQRVAFAVRDFGPGIPPAEMKRLFELFYRPDNELTRTTAGTGIGLALVKQLVTAMSGRVDVRNTDPGAEFRLIFPATP